VVSLLSFFFKLPAFCIFRFRHVGSFQRNVLPFASFFAASGPAWAHPMGNISPLILVGPQILCFWVDCLCSCCIIEGPSPGFSPRAAEWIAQLILDPFSFSLYPPFNFSPYIASLAALGAVWAWRPPFFCCTLSLAFVHFHFGFGVGASSRSAFFFVLLLKNLFGFFFFPFACPTFSANVRVPGSSGLPYRTRVFLFFLVCFSPQARVVCCFHFHCKFLPSSASSFSPLFTFVPIFQKRHRRFPFLVDHVHQCPSARRVFFSFPLQFVTAAASRFPVPD